MTPNNYLQQYTAPFQPIEIKLDSEADETGSMLAEGYYYPPYLKFETYLDTLSRSELLEVIQQLLVKKYPQQRLTRRQISEFIEMVQTLEDEQVWRRAEIERLNTELTWRTEDIRKLDTERQRLEVLAANHHDKLDAKRSQITVLESERATLRANLTDLRTSTSWRVTAPLRRLSRIAKAFYMPDI